MNRGHKKFLALSHVVLIFVTILCILPFYLLIVASFPEEKYAVTNGFSLIPAHLSTDAYRYLLTKAYLFGRGYLITFIVTICGTLACIFITMAFSYMLSRPGLPFKGFFNFYVVFTMLFNGGLVSTYIMYTQTFHVKNTLWALILPNLLTNAFYIIMVRNYFASNIPEELLEAARIDGCSEAGIFTRVVFPLSKPIIATVGPERHQRKREIPDDRRRKRRHADACQYLPYGSGRYRNHSDPDHLSLLPGLFRKRYYHGSCKRLISRLKTCIISESKK